MVGTRCQGQETSLPSMECSALSVAVKASIQPGRAWIDPCTLEVILHLVHNVVCVLDGAEIVF